MDENRTQNEREEINATLDEIEERDATLDEVEPREAEMTEEELQESLLEDDSSLNGFQKKCARIKDDVWMKIQIAAGIAMGLITAVALFWNSLTGTPEKEGSMFSIPLVIALVVALAGPNIIEKQTARKIPKGRIVMAITLAATIVVYFLILGIRSGFRFN